VAKAVFFDLDTLGGLRFSSPPERAFRLTPYPYIESVLQDLAARVPVGLMSGSSGVDAKRLAAAVRAAGLDAFFDWSLLISRTNGTARGPFALAAGRAGLASEPGACVLVSEDSILRGKAIAAGWRASPHPLLASVVVAGEALRFVRIWRPGTVAAADWRGALSDLPLVPLQLSGEGGRMLTAVASDSAVRQLAAAGFQIEPLGGDDDPGSSDLYIVRDDEAATLGFRPARGQADRLFGAWSNGNRELLLSSSDQDLLIRVPHDRSIEEFHFDSSSHGHNLKLLPDPGLLSVAHSTNGHARLQTLAPERDLTPAEAALVSGLTGARVQAFLDRYSGKAPLGDAPGTPIDSRHILNAGNQRVTTQLVADLRAIGGSALAVSTHTFTHNGASYSNVEAELAGNTADLVLVTAHLDSTAASSPPYNPSGDPAPGADDDASGLAAVLAAADVVCRLAAVQKPERTIRFVLFNAEEHGLVGSQAYARDAQAAGAAIEAVYQMDMIGYNIADPRTCEVHAGFLGSAPVQARSAVIAERVRRLAAAVAPAVGPMQLYLSSAGNPDPAEGRSDHAPFQARGYAACVATEDFFAGPGSSAPAEANPNYHRKTDTFVDLAYAADIARSIAAAAWITACPIAAVTPQGDSMSIKIAAGSTTPGSTNWQPYSGNTGVFLDIDTSAGKFSTTPKYFTSLGGNSSHWSTTGITSIYTPSATGFRVYVRWSNGSTLTPAQANSFQWHVNWIGVEA
jgi:hypothetical protein